MHLQPYPVRFRARFRLDDLDFNGHVNNVAVSVLHQESRATLLQTVWPREGETRQVQLIAVQFVTHYLGEGFYPGEVECCAGVGRIGTSALTVATALFDGTRCLSVADTVLVTRSDGTVEPLTDADRARLASVSLVAPG